MEIKQGNDYLANFTLALLEYTKSGEQINNNENIYIKTTIIINLGSPVIKPAEPLFVSTLFPFV
jgi:hypothetical protein